MISVGRVYGSKLWCVRSTEGTAKEIMAVGFEFDCFVVNRTVNAVVEQASLIEAIACRVSDWVEVFGIDAERIHDAIDEASVRLMRQESVGDGNPMTAWYDDVSENSAIASYILTGGHGAASHKVLVVIGSPGDEASLLEALRQEVASRRRWICGH